MRYVVILHEMFVQEFLLVVVFYLKQGRIQLLALAHGIHPVEPGVSEIIAESSGVAIGPAFKQTWRQFVQVVSDEIDV